MKGIIRARSLAVAIVSSVGLLGMTAGAAGAVTTKTFSFIGPPNGSKGITIVNVDGFLMNARCNASGAPVIFGFSSASQGDLEAHMVDGLGNLHTVHNTSFSKGTKGVQLSTNSNDFDSTGIALFETGGGKVVSVTYAYDNATTLNKRNVCTVYGSYVAS